MGDLHSGLLLEVALDLANNVNRDDRFDRLLTSVRKVIQCDAVALLQLRGNILSPLAIQGLSEDVLGRQFDINDHPRLKCICESRTMTRFASDCPLPDPYDGLLLVREGNLPVHSCLGLPLYCNGELLGVVTADSLEADAFNSISDRTLALLAALSSASLKAAMEINSLRSQAWQADKVVKELALASQPKHESELIGRSSAMRELQQHIGTVARSEYTVLIQGETGVGKELVAHNIHHCSRRSHTPMVFLNCASLPESLAESELFGHGKGAFSGADQERMGKFRLANGGTLFLDEIGELPLLIQSKLLRVLQSGEVQPIGWDKVVNVDVRVIAATNRDLRQEVEAGRFRRDLYHRLELYPIRVPPLRERTDDILLLAGHFLERVRRKLGIRQVKLTAQASTVLVEYSWPGNVRELEHVISRAVLLSQVKSTSESIVTVTHHHIDVGGSIKEARLNQNHAEVAGDFDLFKDGLKASIQAFQRRAIVSALQACDGNWSRAASRLQIDRANLMRLAKRLDVRVIREVK